MFGSVVSGTFDAARSDVDALVVFEPTLGLPRFDAYFDLIEDLEALFGRRSTS